MGLFDSPVAKIQNFVEHKRGSPDFREWPLNEPAQWPRESTLVLEDDTALELGNPRQGSLSLITWTEIKFPANSAILIGPDLAEMKTTSAPFAQIVLLAGQFDDEYESFTEIRDAIYDVKLKGMMSRVMPSRQTVWDRVNRDALDHGLSLRHLASALADELLELETVSGVKIIFVTADELSALADAAHEIERIVGALMKMTEEMSYDCDACEYNDVCDEVTELKKIRARLREGE